MWQQVVGEGRPAPLKAVRSFAGPYGYLCSLHQALPAHTGTLLLRAMTLTQHSLLL